MLSTIALTAAVLVLEPDNIPLCTFCAAVAVFVIFTHRSNIARMRAGKENRVRRLWLFRSRAA
jgi:glycerol-3-phosphate acyltransferase PlsY